MKPLAQWILILFVACIGIGAAMWVMLGQTP